MTSELVSITLTRDEALVLFEWLARSDDASLLQTEHPAEQRVLWKLEGQLEKQVNGFSPNYKDLLDQARASVASE